MEPEPRPYQDRIDDLGVRAGTHRATNEELHERATLFDDLNIYDDFDDDDIDYDDEDRQPNPNQGYSNRELVAAAQFREYGYGKVRTNLLVSGEALAYPWYKNREMATIMGPLTRAQDRYLEDEREESYWHERGDVDPPDPYRNHPALQYKPNEHRGEPTAEFYDLIGAENTAKRMRTEAVNAARHIRLRGAEPIAEDDPFWQKFGK